MRAVLQLFTGFGGVYDRGRHRQPAPRTIPVSERNDGQWITFLESVVPRRYIRWQLEADFLDGFFELFQRHLGARCPLFFFGKVEFLQLDQLIQNTIHSNPDAG